VSTRIFPRAARDEANKDALLRREFHANAKVEVSRFKGLGEMMAAQLKETTMDPDRRTLLRVKLIEAERTYQIDVTHDGFSLRSTHPTSFAPRWRSILLDTPPAVAIDAAALLAARLGC